MMVPPGGLSGCFCQLLSWTRAVAIWFMHGVTSITIDSPWRLLHRDECGKVRLSFVDFKALWKP
jgi:hypothetical protein